MKLILGGRCEYFVKIKNESQYLKMEFSEDVKNLTNNSTKWKSTNSLETQLDFFADGRKCEKHFQLFVVYVTICMKSHYSKYRYVIIDQANGNDCNTMRLLFPVRVPLA